MTQFKLELDSSSITEYGDWDGRISIGSFTESLDINRAYWTTGQYRAQWEYARDELLAGTSPGCFVTSIGSQDVFAFVWVFYLVDGNVIFQNRFLPTIPIAEFGYDFSWIVPHSSQTEDGEKISEWVLPLDGITISLDVH